MGTRFAALDVVRAAVFPAAALLAASVVHADDASSSPDLEMGSTVRVRFDQLGLVGGVVSAPGDEWRPVDEHDVGLADRSDEPESPERQVPR